MKTKYGKYQLGQWKIPESEYGKPYSEGMWMLTAETVSMVTGTVFMFYKGVFNSNLWKEGKKLEKELRKRKWILTNLKFTKL